MVQMRWLITNYEKRKLQYRYYYDTNTAIMSGQLNAMGTPRFQPNMQWSEWIDVPNVDIEDIRNDI